MASTQPHKGHYMIIKGQPNCNLHFSPGRICLMSCYQWNDSGYACRIIKARIYLGLYDFKDGYFLGPANILGYFEVIYLYITAHFLVDRVLHKTAPSNRQMSSNSYNLHKGESYLCTFINTITPCMPLEAWLYLV